MKNGIFRLDSFICRFNRTVFCCKIYDKKIKADVLAEAVAAEIALNAVINVINKKQLCIYYDAGLFLEYCITVIISEFYIKV